MPQKLNIEKLKRTAKDLKRTRGITHARALEYVAREKGYESWMALMASQNQIDRDEERAEEREREQQPGPDAYLSPYDNPRLVRQIFR